VSEFIKSWQEAHGLNADGAIGKDTLIAMHNHLCLPSLQATAHFVGNTYHETGGFRVFEENLNYSAQGLAATWPNRYKGVDGKPNKLALEIARKPKEIANHTYANRMGNGDYLSGDGFKYRGRGALQTTGRNNYKLLGDYLKVDLLSKPELVATEYALESAIFYFESNKLWRAASEVNDEAIRQVRKAVNGGTIGLPSVTELVYKFWNLIKP
jgi:putative chitinase